MHLYIYIYIYIYIYTFLQFCTKPNLPNSFRYKDQRAMPS